MTGRRRVVASVVAALCALAAPAMAGGGAPAGSTTGGPLPSPPAGAASSPTGTPTGSSGPSGPSSSTQALAAQATSLSHTVASLQLKGEQLDQAYDRTEESLARAVIAQTRAEEALASAQAQAASATGLETRTVTALYEAGSPLGAIGSAIENGDLVDPLTSGFGISTVLSQDAAAVSRAQAAELTARIQAQVASALVTQQLDLASAAQARADALHQLLAEQTTLLAHASAAVRKIAAADAAASAARDAREFAAALAAAGSHGGSAPNDQAEQALSFARSRLGDPYVWGGTGPTEFDCSGLVQWAYAHAGVSLPRTAAEQYPTGLHPSLAELLPGDLLFWASSPTDPTTIYHVGMYIGGGMMIDAPHTGAFVRVEPVWLSDFFGATRPTVAA
jgi:peptidoglycan DL-endopeptidase CwlO